MNIRERLYSGVNPFLLIYLAGIILLISLNACYTPGKAIGQAEKAMNKYPEKVLPVFRGKFPCITTSTKTTVDSSDYKAWKAHTDSIIEFYKTLLDNVEPEIIHDTVPVPDSTKCNEVLSQYRASDKKHKERESLLQSTIKDLQQKLASIPPVKESTVNNIKDDSEVKECELKADRYKQMAEKSDRENEKKATLIKWILILLAGSIVGNILQFKKIF